ncbi:MAG TPA: hypothetical protein VJP86_07130 [Vicinamibacterales bacterium]|jgi:hypothetical protein|nr:hypothetical protein [Vicinamibacterales bacterium]
MKKLFAVFVLSAMFTVARSGVVSAQDAPAAGPAPAAAPAAAPTPAAPEVAGDWNVTTISPQGETTNLMVVSREGDALKAVAKSDLGELPYDSFAVTGSSVKFVLTIDFQGSPMIITYTGTSDGKKMDGTCDFGGLAEGTWSAVRK